MFYVLDNEKIWRPINGQNLTTVTYPITFTFGIDEAPDIAQLSFFAPPDYLMVLNAVLKQEEEGGIVYYWIVKDFKSTITVQDPTKKLVTLTLVEPIEVLKGFKLPPCAFAEGAYNFKELIERLNGLALFDGEVGDIDFDYNNPKLSYTSATLYMALFELGRFFDLLPYLDFNEETKKWIINFMRLDGLNGKTYPISVFDNPTELLDYTGDGISKYVYSEVSNIVINSNFKEPNIGYLSPEPSDGTDTVNNTNIGLELQNKVGKLRRLTLYGFSRLQGESGVYDYYIDYDNAWVFEDGEYLSYLRESSSTGYDRILIRFIAEEEYQSLTPDEQQLRGTCYIRYTENWVLLSDLKKFLNLSNNVWITQTVLVDNTANFLNALGFFLNESGNFNTEYGFAKAQAVVDYSAVITDTIPLMFANNSLYSDITSYNQTSQQVDSNRIGRVLQTYIDNMESPSTRRTAVFNKWSEIPLEGSLIIENDYTYYLIDSITVEDNGSFLNVDAQLVSEHAKRRENIEADSDLQLNEIPNKDTLNKLVNDLITVNVQFSQARGAGLNSYETGFEFNLINMFNASLQNFRFYNIFTFRNTEGVGLYQYPTIFRLSNNIVFREKAHTNLIWDEHTDEHGEVIVTYYTGEDARYQRATIRLVDAENNVIFISSNYGVNNLKDPYEIFDFTLQIAFKGLRGIIVREEFLEDLLIEFPLKLGELDSATIKLFNKNIGKYDSIPNDEIYSAEITFGALLDNDNRPYVPINFETITQNYKSFVLLKNNKPYFIKNFFTTQTTLEPFNICFSFVQETKKRDGIEHV